MGIIERRNNQNDRSNELRETFAKGEIVSNSDKETPGKELRRDGPRYEQAMKRARTFMRSHNRAFRKLAE